MVPNEYDKLGSFGWYLRCFFQLVAQRRVGCSAFGGPHANMPQPCSRSPVVHTVLREAARGLEAVGGLLG